MRMHTQMARLATAAALAGFGLIAQAQSGTPSTSPAQPGGVQPTPAAQADDGKALVRQAFTRADSDKDGKLSPQEAAQLPAVAAKFVELDTDKDGFISADEFLIAVKVGG